VLGAGGAARAVVLALKSAGAQPTVAARSAEKGAALAKELACASVPWSAIPSTPHDVLVHTTPVGTAGSSNGACPISPEWLRPGTLVLDAVYNPIRTPLLEAARSRGCTPVPGAEWFVRQAAAQFRAFTHQDPDDAVLRAAFENALSASAS
jgi:3-dehydroquinate dehydratase/shikimate dehydrogenase